MKTTLMTYLEDKGRRTLFELMAGIVLLDLIALIGNIFIKNGNAFVKNRLAYTLGIILGMTVALLMALHMYKTLEKAILCDKERAKSKTRLAAFLRMLMMVASLAAAALFPDYISIIALMIGILAMKASALMQPLTDKFVLKILSKGG
ncbi:MAG: hypothetical protein J6Z46_05740 [Lachnospiraceae bacterium]|nr:hypothetical protein [Lachnospiraceae bacterium]